MRRKDSKITIFTDRAVVSLTQGYIAIIDLCDVDLVSGHAWQAFVRNENLTYAMAHSRGGGKRRCIYMHKLILPVEKPLTVDHRDGDGLNNRRYNLRPAEKAQQSWNVRKPTGGTSALKGVHWLSREGKWRSRIKVRGQDVTVGYFDSELEAKAAYDAAARHHHGEFARS